MRVPRGRGGGGAAMRGVCDVRCCESIHMRGAAHREAGLGLGIGIGVGVGVRRTERPSVSMSFLFSFERKAAKTLAMHAASRAHTEKSATEEG